MSLTYAGISRESNDADFDWFKSYSELAPMIRELIPDQASKIIMLGCGNSKLSEEVSIQYPFGIERWYLRSYEMWEDGYKNIINTDVCVPALLHQRSEC